MTERRRFLRFDAALNALCEFANGKHKESSNVRNISKEGALLILSKPLPQGEEFTLKMDVPGDNIPVFACCSVAWQRSINQKDKAGSYETGVKFTKMESPDRGRLLEFIYTQWLRLLDI